MAKKGKKSRKSETYQKAQAALARVKELHERGQSEVVEVRNSEIHGRGVYAACDILEEQQVIEYVGEPIDNCLLYTSPSPRDATLSRMPSSA